MNLYISSTVSEKDETFDTSIENIYLYVCRSSFKYFSSDFLLSEMLYATLYASDRDLIPLISFRY
jgi:hypothetical protein